MCIRDSVEGEVAGHSCQYGVDTVGAVALLRHQSAQEVVAKALRQIRDEEVGRTVMGRIGAGVGAPRCLL